MQKLFSTFPEGRPGIGLVFLRAVTAMPLVELMAAAPPTALPVSVIELVAAACSALLIVGLWTPLAGLFMAVAELSLVFLHFGSTSMHIALAAVGVALAMIGPGAWSVDARLFGRKRIRIPQN